MYNALPEWLQEILPILILLAAVSIVISSLPRVDLGHSASFLNRRRLNWVPLGLTYAFLYMGRYNLNVAKTAMGELITVQDFSNIFAAGTITYGISFLLNGPLTDRFGGKAAILVGAAGAAFMNLLMGLVVYSGRTENIPAIFSVLYAGNMYFQSFGAVAIVKVNAPWFHVRERGLLGAVFGILISLGLYFAYDWGKLIVDNMSTYWVFVIPALVLMAFCLIDLIIVKDTPSLAGYKEFDTGDATLADDGQIGALEVIHRMLTNPIILTIAVIEFCSGFLRQAIMQYYPFFAKATGIWEGFVSQNWGLLLCCAGILGGTFAGIISDRIFHSRRGPVAAVLYGLMLVGSVCAAFLLKSPLLGALIVIMSMAIIGVHGMLSGTASMDFGGKKNAGVAVGIIDGFVYLGAGTMAILYGYILPKEEAAKNPENWLNWPISMIPVALVGLILAQRLWHATPRSKVSSTPDKQAATP